MNKTVLIALVTVVIILFGAYFLMMNDDHRDISAAEVDFSLSAEDLAKEFQTDGPAASAKYMEKVIELSGKLEKVIPADSLSQLILSTNGPFTLTMEVLTEFNSEAKALSPGASLKLKGLYKGYLEADEEFEMPGDIQFRKTSIIK